MLICIRSLELTHLITENLYPLIQGNSPFPLPPVPGNLSVPEFSRPKNGNNNNTCLVIVVAIK